MASMSQRRHTRQVEAGGVGIGSSYPVSIQSMVKTDPDDFKGTVAQAKALESSGCEVIRIAVKTSDHLGVIPLLKNEVKMPVVADIHFDHRLALRAIEMGADKIRINPGNINGTEHLEEIIKKCKAKKIPVRIGVNSGSVRKHFSDPEKLAEEMKHEALGHIRFFEERDLYDIVVSVKAPDVKTTILANRKISECTDVPIHIGLTATGAPESGIIRSSVAIGALLLEGIGDTLRVSLTDDPIEEVRIAKEILQATGVRRFGFDLISCPTCGRAASGLSDLVKRADKLLRDLSRKRPELVEKFPQIAIMGCEVNGPGEAKAADLGVAFGKQKAVIFKKGKVVTSAKNEIVLKHLIDIITERYD